MDPALCGAPRAGPTGAAWPKANVPAAAAKSTKKRKFRCIFMPTAFSSSGVLVRPRAVNKFIPKARTGHYETEGHGGA